jgi:hypothetical protein
MLLCLMLLLVDGYGLKDRRGMANIYSLHPERLQVVPTTMNLPRSSVVSVSADVIQGLGF